MLPTELMDLCKETNAFETDPWAADAILRVELLTRRVWDPCVGTGALKYPLRHAGYQPFTSDLVDWSQHFDCKPPMKVMDFLTATASPFHGRDFTVFMNPPFDLACEFVDKAKELGARKIVSFQRWAWRESKGRRQWWEANPPARTYVCGERATCWRFDVPKDCVGPELCGKNKGRGVDAVRCRQCMAGSPTAHGWFIWERHHKGAEVMGAIYDDHADNPEVQARNGDHRFGAPDAEAAANG